MKALVQLLAMSAKFALLFVVLFRFHASWVGVSVVLGMAILLFRLDRSFVLWATSLGAARR